MTTNPVGAELAIREAVREKVYSLPIDKMVGQPTMKSWQHLREQLCKVTAQCKSTNWGGRHGHLACVLNDREYQNVTGDNTLVTDLQPKPAQVHPMIDNNTTALERAQLNASQSIQLTAYYSQCAVNEVVVERMVNDIVEKHYVEDLEDEYTGYANQTIKTVLHHIKSEWVIVTTMDITQAKDEFRAPWDMTSHITKFIRELNKRAEYCHLLGIDDINDNSKVQILVENMYACDMFTDTEMDDWETAVDKSWAAAQAYFNRLYKKKKTFNDQRANRRSGYESASSITDKLTASHSNRQNSDTTSIPDSVLTPNTGMTMTEQQAMVDYTSQLETKLNEREQEFAAAMTTTQSNMMQQLQQQQQAMMEQQQKFMEMMMGKFAQQLNVQSDGNKGGDKGNDGKPSGRIKYPKCPNCGKYGKHALTPEKCRGGKKEGEE